jgi:nitrite reductase/ring-hydroxylating ferredoxin subunit
VALANVAGEVFAFEDRCPHLGAPLSRGEMRGRSLVCPWHGWTIDVPTGDVTGGRGAAVRRCRARVRDGQVEVATLGRSGA